MSWCCGTAIVSWFSCYPSPCGSDGCCCNWIKCSENCSSHTVCGQGACCTCDNNNGGFAYAGPRGQDCCGGSGNLGCVCSHGAVDCGNVLWFSGSSTRCQVWNKAVEVDHGPACGLGRAADLTKSLFMQMAPLSQGVIYNTVLSPTCCACC